MNIVLSDVCKSFGNKKVLSDVSITLREGGRYCVMGQSGCGKTTLLHLCIGLTEPDRGTVAGVPNNVSAVFQEDRLCESLTPLANIKAVAGKVKSEREIVDMLSELGLEKETKCPVSSLSGGMKRRVAIARALSVDFDFIILDEPFKGLDELTRKETAAVINKYAFGKTLLLATHDIADAQLLDCEMINNLL